MGFSLRLSRHDPVRTARLIAETLVVSTMAGATIGAEIAGAEGAQVGAVVGLVAGTAFLIYCVSSASSEPDDYRRFYLGEELH